MIREKAGQLLSKSPLHVPNGVQDCRGGLYIAHISKSYSQASGDTRLYGGMELELTRLR